MSRVERRNFAVSYIFCEKKEDTAPNMGAVHGGWSEFLCGILQSLAKGPEAGMLADGIVAVLLHLGQKVEGVIGASQIVEILARLGINQQIGKPRGQRPLRPH